MATNIKSSTKILSNPFVPDTTGGLSTSGLILLGVIAGLLHVHLRYPLNIPGHHGIEWMALLLFGRCLSNQRHAATILAAGAAASYLAQSPFLAFAHDIKPALIFLVTGGCADIIYRFTQNRLPIMINAGVTGALAFITKPVIMYCLFIFTGMKVGMFIKHPDYLPFISHFLFGLVGGVGGVIFALAAIPKKEKTEL